MPHPRSFVALTTAAQVGADRKQWIEILPTATGSRNGPWHFTITAQDLETYAQHIRANPDRIPLDYDHEGAKEGGSSVAAGWFTGQAEVRNTDGGPRLWAEVEWTPQGLEDVQTKRFRFISAEFSFHERDRKTGLLTRAKELLAATLTNRPHFPQLAPVAHELLDTDQYERLDSTFGVPVADLIRAALQSGHQDTAALARTLIESTPLPKETTSMDTTVLAKTLGLPEDASDDQIADAVKASAAAAAKAADLETKVQELEAKVAAGETEKTELEQLRETVAAERKLRLEGEARQAVADAVREFRVTPAMGDVLASQFGENVDALKAVLAANAPGTVKGGKPVGVGDDNDNDDTARAEREFGDGKHTVDGADLHAEALKILAAAGKPADDAEAYADALVQAERNVA